MNKIIHVICILIAITFSPLTVAKDSSPVNQTYPTVDYEQITDSVTQFLRIDINKDEKISLAEASAAGINEATFKKIDTNGDNVISPEEYKVALIILAKQ